MPRQFIKISYSSKPANKLQEAVLKAFMSLDQTDWPHLEGAKFMVFQKFDDAVASYTGRATMSRPYISEYEKNICMIYSDVANVAIYEILPYQNITDKTN